MKNIFTDNLPKSLLFKIIFFVFFIFVVSCASFAFLNYPGNKITYLLFTIISNALLYLGFCKNAIFFDLFIGSFFWLGFWLKLTLRVAFYGGFFDSVGYFDYSALAFDKALWVSNCGLSALLFASLIRRKFFFNYTKQINFSNENLFFAYKRFRKGILILFVLLYLFISISNIIFGIYQKGSIAELNLPFGLNGIYKWLLLFGFTSFSALILNFELKMKKKISLHVMFWTLLECFVSNVSMLSRGMILNFSGLFSGLLVSFKLNAIKLRGSFLVASLLIFSMLFVSSIFMVNYMRSYSFIQDDANTTKLYMSYVHNMNKQLFSDRWVGINGVMAVSSYPNLGWDLLGKALEETYNESDMSFFDKNIININSPYINTDRTKHHFISLSGIVAFFFYPGSFLFLFASIFTLGGFAAMIEFYVYRLGGNNLFLAALFSQVVAYRFSCFGYVPSQSYLLFGALFLNLFLVYFAENLLAFIEEKNWK